MVSELLLSGLDGEVGDKENGVFGLVLIHRMIFII